MIRHVFRRFWRVATVAVNCNTTITMYKDAKAKWHSIAIFVVVGAYGWGPVVARVRLYGGREFDDDDDDGKKRLSLRGHIKRTDKLPQPTHTRAFKLEYYTYMLPGLLSIN